MVLPMGRGKIECEIKREKNGFLDGSNQGGESKELLPSRI